MKNWKEFELESYSVLTKHYGDNYVVVPVCSPSGPAHYQRTTKATGNKEKFNLFPSFFVDFGDKIGKQHWRRPYSITPDFSVINIENIKSIWEVIEVNKNKPKVCKEITLSDLKDKITSFINNRLTGKSNERIATWLFTEEMIEEFFLAKQFEGRFVIFFKQTKTVEAVIDSKNYTKPINKEVITKLHLDSHFSGASEAYILTNKGNLGKNWELKKSFVTESSKYPMFLYKDNNYQAPVNLSKDEFFNKYEENLIIGKKEYHEMKKLKSLKSKK